MKSGQAAMRIISTFIVFGWLGAADQVQAGAPIHIRGKVTASGSPVAGATVTLLGQEKSATTDNQGAYAITGTAVSIARSGRATAGSFRFNHGILELGVPAPSVLKVEVFDVRGDLVHAEAPGMVDAGVYRMDVAATSHPPRILFIKAALGQETRVWRYDPFRKGIHPSAMRAEESRAPVGGGLAKAAAAVDSIRIAKPGFAAKVVAIASYDTTLDISLSPGAGGGLVEDAGYDCKVASATGSNGGSATTLPDPFTRWDGSQVRTLEDWRCRRRELLVEVEKRILGTKAPPPALKGGKVTGTISNTAYTVNVENPDGRASFGGTVTLPSGGQPPYPAIIVVGGFNSLNKNVLADEGVATLSYNNNDIASEASGNYSKGKYFDANPDQKGNTSALAAWAWGVSRILDMLEQNPGVIDPARIGVHGCSRLGKAAFVIGAFDQRIALGLPLEPGTGGPAPLRALPTLGGQTLASANGEASWFGPMSRSYSASMAVDMSDVAALYAPRGLLMMDNAHIAHLSYKANYLGMAAAREVYKAMGREDAAWYLGSSNNGGHCSERAEYGDELRAMIRKFFKGDAGAATGGLDKHANHGNIDVGSWTSAWKKGTLSP